jgi:uncharacterized membrane protein
MKKKLIYYLGILGLSFIACLPLIAPFFKAGFFPTHDGEWAVVRLSDMYRLLKDLQFPARYSGYLNFQYGYPLFNFTYPLPYYLGTFFVFLKFGFVNSIKILFSLSAILSFFSMFLLSKDVWKNKWSALVSAILYVYVPYRIVDLYVRGSIGESLSFVLFPLILLGIKKIYEKGKALDIALTGVLFALLIATHNIMTVLFGIVILFVVLAALIIKQIKFVIKLLTAMFLSLCFSAFFWIPAIFEKNLILLSKIPIADRSLYFVKPLQLIIPQWGYGTPTDPSPFGYQMGIAQLIIFILALIFSLKNIRKDRDAGIAFFFIISTIIISFLFFSPSALLWEVTPLLSEINYPWTLLAVIMFLVSFIAGYFASLGKIFTVVSLAVAVLAVALVIPYARPQYTVNRGDAFYSTNQATTTSSNELMPLWVKKLPTKSWKSKVEVASGTVQNISYNSKKISFLVNLPKTETVRINTIYYPGWTFAIDGVKANINYNNQFGLMDLQNIKAGQHQIKGEFGGTPLRLLSDLISLLSILGFVIYLIYSLAHKFKKR